MGTPYDPRHRAARELSRRANYALRGKMPLRSASLQIGDLFLNKGSSFLTVTRNAHKGNGRIYKEVWTGGEVVSLGTIEDINWAVDVLRRHQVLDELAGIPE